MVGTESREMVKSLNKKQKKRRLLKKFKNTGIKLFLAFISNLKLLLNSFLSIYRHRRLISRRVLAHNIHNQQVSAIKFIKKRKRKNQNLLKSIRMDRFEKNRN